MTNVHAIQNHVVLILREGLSDLLTYHNVDHTLDVARQSIRIAKSEGIVDKQQLMELKIAALYHDTGFLQVYRHHEEKSCEHARKELPGFGIDEKTINNICTIIMATRIPQSPQNHIQQIICDADLDYLGRKDFFETGEKLRKELTAKKIISSRKEWEHTQRIFLQSHKYFTKTSQQEREAGKQKNIQLLLVS